MVRSLTRGRPYITAACISLLAPILPLIGLYEHLSAKLDEAPERKRADPASQIGRS